MAHIHQKTVLFLTEVEGINFKNKKVLLGILEMSRFL